MRALLLFLGNIVKNAKLLRDIYIYLFFSFANLCLMCRRSGTSAVIQVAATFQYCMAASVAE